MNKLDKAYNTYVKKHKELVAKRPDMYGQQYTKDEFEGKYEAAKLKGKANPARTVALDQREWTYNFERSYFKKTGYKVTGAELTNKQLEEYQNKFGITLSEEERKQTREAIFLNYYDLMKQEDPSMSHSQIESQFLAMY